MRHLPGCPLATAEDTTTIVALEAECDECRATVFVGPRSQLGCGVREPKTWTPEPLPGAETALEDVQRKRDGR